MFTKPNNINLYQAQNQNTNFKKKQIPQLA